jgi:hypothetical protein
MNFDSIGKYIFLYILENTEQIEHSLFVDIIALCSFEIVFPEPEPSSIEKVLKIFLF